MENISISHATVQKYKRVKDCFSAYLKHTHHCDDIALSDINHAFIVNFDIYLRTVVNQAHNTAVQTIKYLRGVIINALRNGWISKDPFVDYKVRKEKVKRIALTESELMILMNKKFKTERLTNVRDVFIFSCFSFVQRLKNKDGAICIKVTKQNEQIVMKKWPEMFVSELGYIDPESKMDVDKIEDYYEDLTEEETND